jgi:hypothetical protein
MSMGPWHLYLRHCEATNELYTTQYEDEEKFKNKKEQWKILESRKYGTYEELMKDHCHTIPNTDITFEIVDERDKKFREKWIRFQKDRVVGWKKGERMLTKEMMELLGVDGKVDLDKLTNREKNKYYQLIGRVIMRGMK